MTIFNKHRIYALSTILLCALQSASADVVELTHDDILTGRISAMDQEGITITSSLTPTPLKIKSSHIQNITFETKKASAKKHAELVTLTNGDTLPCQVISLDETSMHISTWYSEKFDIPREDIRSLQFGISEDKVLYRGDDAPSEWSTNEGKWKLSKMGYSCEGSGVLARELKLPENLRIRFGLSWNKTPNLAFRFCAENNKATTKQDTYELLFNSAGLQIRRYLKGKKTAPLASINLKPHEIDNQQLDIDLRINRQLGNVTLYLDGKKRGMWVDTFDSAEGNFIRINNRASRGTDCHIGNFIVSSWKDGSQLSSQESLPQGKTDILIDDEGEQHSGQILSISQAAAKERSMKLKVKHSTQPISVPDRRINTLIFAEREDSKKRPPSSYTAHLVGGGSLQLENPKLANGKITTIHPILGPCTIDTTAVTNIVVQSTTSSK